MDEDPKWSQKAHGVQIRYWDGEEKVSLPAQVELTNQLKQWLGEIREWLKEELERCDKLLEQVDCKPKNIRSDSNKRWKEEWINTVKSFSEECNKKMIEFSGAVIRQAVNICGEQPCKFAAVCMGSMARGEMTPYSDLEFAFLLEHKEAGVEDYFEKLAVTVYFLIGNLAETHLKYMNIEELSGTVCNSWLENKAQTDRWFVDTSVNGFKIDGLSPNAGNIPTGNGSEKQRNHLIATVEELVARYTEVYQQVPDYEKALKGDISAMLSSTALLYGAEHLLNDFRGKITRVQPSPKRQYASREMLLMDAEKFSFEPQKNIMEKVNLKQKVYRFPTILTFDFKILNRLKSSTCWKVLVEAEEERVILPEVAKDLAFLVSVGVYVRLSAYSAYTSQQDVLSVALSSVQTESMSQESDVWKIPRSLLLMMIVDSKRVQRVFKGHGNRQTILDSDCEATDGDALALAWFYCQDYSKFLMSSRAVAAVKEPSENPKWAFMTLKAHLEKSEFSKAEKTINKLMLEDRLIMIDRAEVYQWYGQLLHRQGQYKDALDFYHRSLAIQVVGRAGVAKEDVADCYMDMGRTMHSMACYAEAMEYLEKSLAIKQAVYGEVNHPSIATSYNNIGDVYRSQGNDNRALESYEKSLIMRKAVYGDINHPDIAISSQSIGDIYFSCGDYKRALESYEKSLTIELVVYGEVNHPAIATSYSNIGRVYFSQGNYKRALENFEKSLAMRQNVYGEVNHPQIAISYSEIGNVYCSQGDYKQALENYEKSLTIELVVYGEVNHPAIATSYSDIGYVYCSCGDYKRALENYEKSLAMRQDVYGEVNHP